MAKDRKTTRKGSPKYGPADSMVTPRFSGVRTYARLPHVVDLDGDVDVAVIGVPFDTGGTFRVGARFGPEHIRSASALMRPYHQAHHVALFEQLSVVDYGDLPVVPGYIEESQRRITQGLLEVLRAGVIPIDLGGDHSIALPELRALAKVHGKVALIQLDSHSDTNTAYFGLPHTHGTPMYHAHKEGLLDSAHSIQVGLRGPCPPCGAGSVQADGRGPLTAGAAAPIGCYRTKLPSAITVTRPVGSWTSRSKA